MTFGFLFLKSCCQLVSLAFSGVAHQRSGSQWPSVECIKSVDQHQLGLFTCSSCFKLLWFSVLSLVINLFLLHDCFQVSPIIVKQLPFVIMLLVFRPLFLALGNLLGKIMKIGFHEDLDHLFRPCSFSSHCQCNQNHPVTQVNSLAFLNPLGRYMQRIIIKTIILADQVAACIRSLLMFSQKS